MKALKWLAIVVLGIPALLIAGAYARNKMIGPVGWAQDNTERQLRTKMRDPDSMVIRSSYVITKQAGMGEEIIICGVVDGRNAFGGYAGGSRFVSRSISSSDTFDTWWVQLEDPRETAQAREVNSLSGFESVYWNNSCVDASHPALVPGT